MAETLPNLFFLNEKLHKKLKIVKSEDLLVAYCYPDEQRVHYLYSLVRRDYQKAYTLSEVAKLVRRPNEEIHRFLKNKLIDRPSGFEYHIETRRPRRMYWSQTEVLDLRDRLYELAPKGKDGFPLGSFRLASKAELLEAINGDASYYVRSADGQFIRVWKSL